MEEDAMQAPTDAPRILVETLGGDSRKSSEPRARQSRACDRRREKQDQHEEIAQSFEQRQRENIETDVAAEAGLLQAERHTFERLEVDVPTGRFALRGK